MKMLTRTILALALTVSWAVPAAPQSANRTGPPAPPPARQTTQAPVVSPTPESTAVKNCRAHCDSLSATALRPQRSEVEKTATKTACAKTMVG